MSLEMKGKPIRFADWTIGLKRMPDYIKPYEFACDSKIYFDEYLNADQHNLQSSPKAARTYALYLYECLQGLNALYWAHHNGHGIKEILVLQLNKCFVSNQPWQYTVPFLLAAIEDLPARSEQSGTLRHAWDWVDATFKEGWRLNQIWGFNDYRYRMAIVLESMINVGVCGEDVSRKALFESEGLIEQTAPSVGTLAFLELTGILMHCEFPNAAQEIIELFSQQGKMLSAKGGTSEVMSNVTQKGWEEAYHRLKREHLPHLANDDGSAVARPLPEADVRRSSGAISDSVFRTLQS